MLTGREFAQEAARLTRYLHVLGAVASHCSQNLTRCDLKPPLAPKSSTLKVAGPSHWSSYQSMVYNLASRSYFTKYHPLVSEHVSNQQATFWNCTGNLKLNRVYSLVLKNRNDGSTQLYRAYPTWGDFTWKFSETSNTAWGRSSSPSFSIVGSEALSTKLLRDHEFYGHMLKMLLEKYYYLLTVFIWIIVWWVRLFSVVDPVERSGAALKELNIADGLHIKWRLNQTPIQSSVHWTSERTRCELYLYAKEYQVPVHSSCNNEPKKARNCGLCLGPHLFNISLIKWIIKEILIWLSK